MDSSKQQLDDCTELPEDGKRPKEIALARCNCLMKRYLRSKEKHLLYSVWAQRVALVSTAIIPVLLLIRWNHSEISGAAFSAIAATATGFLTISGWRENYIRYGYVWHALQTEKYIYLTRAAPEYSECTEDEATRRFARRIERLVMADAEDWRDAMQRSDGQGSPSVV